MLLHDTNPRPAPLTDEWVPIPAGSFLMGSRGPNGDAQERPAHEVHVSAFRAGRYCVTVEDYFAFVEETGPRAQEAWCDFINPCFIVSYGYRCAIRAGAERYPMVQVSFVGAVEYCNWLSRRLGLHPVYDTRTLEADLGAGGVRLLTEAEWEYACGGPNHHPYGHGDEYAADRVCGRDYAGGFAHLRAGHRGVGGFTPHEGGPLPVGTLPPNGFGLHEMLGNVNEWCHDRYAPYDPEPAQDPAGAAAGSFRVIRGGSFIDDPERLRTSYRHAIHCQSRCMVDGFRIAMNG